ncbi:MAG: hypothetical protein [Bacteriophage sp.]|nr:MAG: hypothetical protein [Bacteriophage sp.]
MIESLLYPKKIKTPPQLLVDVAAMLNGQTGNQFMPLIGIEGISDDMKYRLIDISSDGSNTFRIGCIKKISASSNSANVRMTLPFQEVGVTTDETRCHGWDTTDADLLSTPSKTVIQKGKIPGVRAAGRGYYSSKYGSLFKMESNEFEGDGSGPQFSSDGLYTGVDFTIYPDTFDIGSVFPDMVSNYASKTLAIEIVAKIKVYSGNTSDGFRTGLVEP